MRPQLVRLSPLRVLAWRAVALYTLLRLLVTGVGAVVERLGVPGPDSPLGVVALVMILAVVDMRRRGERILWSNLGYSPVVSIGLFGAIALFGEVLLAAMRT